MAPLPKTALRQENLSVISDEPETSSPLGISNSAHKPKRVSFLDFDGKTKTGFFKSLSDNYGELLAKFSVATSVIARLGLGERAADDRLVYDNNDRIVGSLSLTIDGFVPFHSFVDSIPSNPELAEKVIPSCNSLLKHNVMEILFFAYYLQNDDLHPKNMAPDGKLIDYDKCLYAVTEIIDGPRHIGGTAQGRIQLTAKDFGNFPVLSDSTPTHWPTNFPKNGYFIKSYPQKTGASFIELASNPEYEDPQTGKKVTAQRQLFTAALKALLTYQPKVLRARLEDALGLEPLNYTSLDATKQSNLERHFEKLFTVDTNKKPFIDVMMPLFQAYYDELYRTVVFYEGCESNSSKQKIPAFNQFLYQCPSAYIEVRSWVQKENKRLRLSSRAQQSASASSQAGVHPHLLNTEELERRYHKIWRDANVLKIKSIYHKALQLSHTLQKELSRPTTSRAPASIQNRQLKPEDVTETAQLMADFEEENSHIIEEQIDCEKNSTYAAALKDIIRINNQFLNATKEYTALNIDDLHAKANTDLLDKLRGLYHEYYGVIPKLGMNTSFGKTAETIAQELQSFQEMASFSTLLAAPDNDSPLPLVLLSEHKRNHTDDDIVDQCITSLFEWVKELDPNEFSSRVTKIIDEQYSSALPFFNRKRGDSVKYYLERSINANGAERLAFILSSGNPTENGALNTLLIKMLIPEMLYSASTLADIDVYLPSVIEAIENNYFNAEIYTKKAIEFSKSTSEYKHLYSSYAEELVNKILYQWVDHMSATQFKAIVDSALKEYSEGTWFTPARKSEVSGYFNSNQPASNSKILSFIFSNGGVKSNSLNTILFKKLILNIDSNTPVGSQRMAQDRYQFIHRIQTGPVGHTEHFAKTLKDYAIAASHDQLDFKDEAPLELEDSALAFAC